MKVKQIGSSTVPTNPDRPGTLVILLTIFLAVAPWRLAAEETKEPAFAKDHPTGLEKIKAKLGTLETAVAVAKKDGIDTSYEEVTVFIAREFVTYIGWDVTHPDDWKRITGEYRPVRNRVAELAAAIPAQEVADTLTILDNALAELARVRKNPASRRLATTPSNSAKPDLSGEYCYEGNRPVFRSTFCWMIDDEAYTRAFGFIPRITLSLKDLPGEGLGPTMEAVSQIRQRANSLGRRGAVLETFLVNEPPSWAVDKYPEITEGRRQFIGYDIDHPKVREMWRRYLAEVVPVLAESGGGSVVYMLANEPHWFTTTRVWSTGTVSAYTWQRFGTWLTQRYNNDLVALNQRWGRKFTSFEAVRLDLPMDRSMKGSALWYDWCRFNMDRVNDWFTFLTTEIKKHDPLAKCSIKLISKLNISTEFEKDNGLDFETLTSDVQDLSGADTDPEPPCNDGFRTQRRPEWQDTYALDWEGQSIHYDFLKSLAPQKLLFDSEYHAFSTVSWRFPAMGEDYVRTVLWLAHLHGLGMNKSWYLPRFNSGSVTLHSEGDIYGSAAMQPLVLDAYGRAMKELNVYAPEVIALAKAPKSVRFFYSTDAAIQSPSYHRTLLKAYEAGYFLSVPLGFVTERMLTNAELSQLKEYPLLIVPSATHVRDSAVVALKRYAQSGGKLVLLGGASLLLDEYGRERDKNTLAFLKDAPRIGAEETAAAMASRIEALIDSAGIKRPVVCRSEDGKVPWGVHCVSVKRGEATLVHVVNLAKDARIVSLWAGGQAVGEALDLWRNEKTSVRQMTLQPYEMRLVSIFREKGN